MANEQNLKPFKKGHDPRRNLRGVPKDAIAMRKLIREIGAELITLPKDADGKSPEVTRLYAKIRQMYSSRAPADSQAILKALAPGLLTDTVALTGAIHEIDYSIFDIDELTRITSGESETVVYADALKRIAASQSQSAA